MRRAHQRIPKRRLTCDDGVSGTHRVAFGMRRFRNYSIRALLYAGRPNWTLLDTLTPP